MPEYLSPGVYVEEIEIGGKPVEGVSTSTAGFLGETERGPTAPKLITSWLDYQRVFGSYVGKDKYFPYAVQGFFANGGQRCFIGRVVKKDAPAASLRLKEGDNYALTVEAVGEGEWGNRVAVKVTKGTMQGFKLSIFYWKTEIPLYDPETDLKKTPRPAVTEEFNNLMVDETSPDFYGKKVNGISRFVRLTHLNGDTGKVPEGEMGQGKVLGATKSDIELSGDGDYKGMYIKITSGEGSGQIRKITVYDKSTRKGTVEENWDIVPDKTSSYIMFGTLGYLQGGSDFSIVKSGTAAAGSVETITLSEGAGEDAYNGMQIEIVKGTGKGQKRLIMGYDKYKIATVDRNWDTVPDGTSEFRVIDIRSGMVLGDYLREDTLPGNRKGLAGFAEIDEISILYSPNALNVTGLADSLIAHCEKLKDRFAIIDSEINTTDIGKLNPKDEYKIETKYAAFYYPWIKVTDPDLGVLVTVPPGGHMAGIYARTDTERGVFKAPANEVVSGAQDLEFQITKNEQDLLNPRGVNVIRAFPGRGIRVWGARTLSSDPLWKYINVRRLFIFLEESIDEATQWVVFEPNDEKLWARVKRTITEFLTRVWRDGALMGSKTEEAFFVKVDRSTMTQDDIDNGRLVVLIGVAPVKPAEFVIFRIAQVSSGSEVSE